MRQTLPVLTYALTSLVGVSAFLYPFWLPQVTASASGDMAHAGDSALMVTLLVGLCFAVLLLEVQREAVSAKTIALLGVLVAINATLRFVEVALPGPGGFSPIFPLIVFGGYVFGGGFGFLLGALTLLVSGLVTGGIGPWLPYQMFTAGWVGLSAPLCRPMVRMLGGTRGEVWVLALFAGYWGLLFGAIMNLWFWPFTVGPTQMYWTPGAGAIETIQRYLVFYVVTSLVWDFTGPIIASTYAYAFTLTCPKVYFDTSAIDVSGAGVISASVPFTARYDTTNGYPTLKYMSVNDTGL